MTFHMIFGASDVGGVTIIVEDCLFLSSVVLPQDTVSFILEDCPSFQSIEFQNSNVIHGFGIDNSSPLYTIDIIDFSNTQGFIVDGVFPSSVGIDAPVNCILLDNGNQQCLNINFSCNGDDDNETCIQVENPILMEAAHFTSDSYFSTNCSNCTSSLTELTTSKNLIQILDLMGRETSFKPNTPLIYVYDDGSIEKVFSVEY